MIGTPFGITFDRYQEMDITAPLVIDSHNIVYKYPTLDTDIAGFVKPLTFTVI